MDNDSAEYLRRREHAERAAAKNACCLNARRAHQELAQNYACLRQQESKSPSLGQQPEHSGLTIVTP